MIPARSIFPGRGSTVAWRSAAAAGAAGVLHPAARRRARRHPRDLLLRGPDLLPALPLSTGQRCVDLKADQQNCGRCERACAVEQICRDGERVCPNPHQPGTLASETSVPTCETIRATAARTRCPPGRSAAMADASTWRLIRATAARAATQGESCFAGTCRSSCGLRVHNSCQGRSVAGTNSETTDNWRSCGNGRLRHRVVCLCGTFVCREGHKARARGLTLRAYLAVLRQLCLQPQ